MRLASVGVARLERRGRAAASRNVALRGVTENAASARYLRFKASPLKPRADHAGPVRLEQDWLTSPSSSSTQSGLYRTP